MALLHPANFASVVASSKDSLKKISHIIAKYCGNDSAENFMNACQKLDFTIANRILEDTIKKISDYNSVLMALNTFADKFPQISSFSNQVSSALSESDKIKIIDSYSKQIINIIDREY